VLSLEKVVACVKPTVLAFYEGLFSGATLIALSLFLIVQSSSTPFIQWFSIVASALGVLNIALSFLRAWASTYVVTDRGVRAEYRFIVVEISEVPHEKITDIVVQQSLFGRLLGFGTVRVDSAGTSFQGAVLRGVRNPEELKRIISEQRSAAEGRALGVQ